MTGVHSPLALMRRAVLPALGVLIIANFLGYAIIGENGVFSWGDYRRIKAERAIELAQLEQERVRLAHRAQLLDPRRVDPDLADELIRGQLGLVRPDEVIIEIDDAPAVAPAAAAR
ncbi:MAG: FtsB family cell division protein [Allosphingosinicella sp.]